MQKYFITIGILITILFVACQKDISQLTGVPFEYYKSDIFGRVLDEENQPVSEAIVRFGNIVTTTDINGVYQFKNVQISAQHSFLSIVKEGYFEGSRGFNTFESGKTLNLVSVLLKKSFNQSFSADQGGEISDGDLTVLFRPNSIKYENSGLDYSGQVHAAIKYLDPSNDDIYTQMPGNLTAIDQQDNIVTLVTYGMAAVELRADNGQKLNLKADTPAVMSVDLPSGYVSSAPDNIPLWYFDNSLGMWVEEGTATLMNGTYTGEVVHFSWWNFDVPFSSVNISGRVVDQEGNPLPNVAVRFVMQGRFNGSRMFTNSEGMFSGPVPRNEILEVIIYKDFFCNYDVQSSQFGPFIQDVTIPDIVINGSNLSSYKITGNVVDCSQNPIENGYVKLVGPNIRTDIHPIVNGEYNINLLHCNSHLTIDLIGVDKNTLEEGAPIRIQEAGEYHFDNVEACGVDTEYIYIQCKTFSILSETLFHANSLKSYPGSDYFRFTSWPTDDQSTLFSGLSFGFKGLGQGAVLNRNTYPLTGDFNIKNSLNTGLYVGRHSVFVDYHTDEPIGEVKILNTGFVGDMVRGTFEFTSIIRGNDGWGDVEFVGHFQLRLGR